jgi:hypothetical protein
MKPTKHNVNDLYSRALSHHSRGDLGLAMKKYLAIIERFPTHLGCLHNVARLHMAVNNTTEATDYLTRIIGINRQDHEAFLYRADCHRITHDTALALEDCHASIDIQDTALAHNTLALVYRDLGQFDAAQAEWQRCFEMEPDNRAKWAINMGQALLLNRDYAQGFKLYEGRNHAGVLSVRPQVKDKPTWLGAESCAGKRIIMHSEQGVGDTIHMLRYAEVFKSQGAAWVGVVVPAELSMLAQGTPGVDLVVTDGDEWPTWDLHLPMMSAPRAARTLFQTIPWQGAYIRRKDHESTTLNQLPRSIGLVWSGSPRMFHEEMWMRPPKGRDMPQTVMLDLVQQIRALYPTITLVSLQAGRPIPSDVGLDKPELKDWTTTADIIDTLDLVISVDTAVAHLAGAMARPVWLLNRKSGDWRWHLDMTTSPWYPSMQIFTQTEFNSWDSVAHQVLAQLEALANGKS